MCWEGNVLCDTNFPLRREVPSRNCYHIFPQYASLHTGSTSWHEREINRSKTHPSTFTKTHTCARLHTTVRSVAFISQNISQVSLRSRGLKKNKKKQNNNNRNYIWCLIMGKTHQHTGVGTTAWQIRRRFGVKELKTQDGRQKVRAKKKIPQFCSWQQNHNQVFYEKLHPVLHLCGRRSSARAPCYLPDNWGDCLDYTFSY